MFRDDTVRSAQDGLRAPTDEEAASRSKTDGEIEAYLFELNRRRLAPRLPGADTVVEIDNEARALWCEYELVQRSRRHVAERAAAAPTDADELLAWFEDLERTGPGQNDPLFPWLRERASMEQMRWFLTQEAAGEAGFDDLVALTQIKMPTRAKLELGRNFWDELGRGSAAGMHGPMLARLVDALELDLTTPPVEEAFALSNLMVALAGNRAFAFHSVGALGVIELTAPGRAEHVNAGLRRLGVPANVRQYYALHATLDRQHSAAWNREVIGPLVREDPARGRAIAEGALLRLRAGARCFERYRRELGLG